MPQPPQVLLLSERLRAAYEAAWARVKAEEAAIIDNPAAYRRLSRLRELERRIVADMDQLDAAASAWLGESFPAIYAAGAQAVSVELGHLFEFSLSHRSAIASIAHDTFADLLKATTGVRRTTKELVRRLSRETTLSKLIEGRTAQEASKALAADLQRRGIYSVVYSDGSRHGIAEYADVVLRTKTAVAYNAGSLNVAKANGVLYMEVFDGPDCFPGDQAFRAHDGLRHLLRGEYAGPMVRLTTRCGTHLDVLTVGPNHPVLTGQGWVLASDIREGDELVYDAGFDTRVAVADDDLNEHGESAEHCFATFALDGIRTARAAGEYLHGDACWLTNAEVQVVGPERHLLIERDTLTEQLARQNDLVRTDADLTLVTSNGSGEMFAFGMNPIPGAVVSAVKNGVALGGRAVRPLSGDSTRTRAIRAGGSPLGGAAPLADVVATELLYFEGHVFDASTVAGTVGLGAFVVQNCGWIGHEDTDLANGSIRTVEECDGVVISHPNCQRSFGPRPDITTDAQARDGGGSTILGLPVLA